MGTDVVQDIELGRELARVRELAELTQRDLATRLGLSQAVVSRTESGERRLETVRLREYAEAIGTEEARRIETRRSREWSELRRPSLGHPDHDVLWTAEDALSDLRTLLDKPDITQTFAVRIKTLCDEIKAAAEKLLKRECSLIFIGKIGVGKTSALCHIADLTVSKRRSPRLIPVLDVGAGRTTLCEVHVRTGPTSIVIEPSTDAETSAHVADFAEKILYATMGGDKKAAAPNDQIMPLEVERVIRNMANLKRSQIDGGQIPDPARELAQRVIAEEDQEKVEARLQFEILSRMRTGRRRRLGMQWDEGTGVDSLQWLKSEFHRINIGDNPEFPIPRRIEVLVERPLLVGVDDVEVSMVDTKGIDETVARADLAKHVGASHTVLVLCSGFNEAPGKETRELLHRASKTGIEGDRIQGVGLGLPRMDEALQMLDDAGEAVESAEEGCRLKAGVVEEIFQSLGFRDFSVSIFNSHEDDPDDVRQELSKRIGMVYDGYRNAVNELVKSASGLAENYQDEQALEVIRQATRIVRSWIDKNMSLNSVKRVAESSLLDEVKRSYPATIHATMRRKGGWSNLDYGHQLGYGARLIVSSVLRGRVQSFGHLCDVFLGVEGHHHAQVLLDQTRRALGRAFQTVTERAQLLGETWFHHNLEEKEIFWVEGRRRWGAGAGYVNDILSMNRSWFSDNSGLNEEVKEMVSSEWKQAMQIVAGMLERE